MYKHLHSRLDQGHCKEFLSGDPKHAANFFYNDSSMKPH